MPSLLVNSTILERDDYVPPTFENTFAINQMHNAFRFGNPSDVTVLASDEFGADQQAYLVGLAGFSILILSITTLWILTLIILKLLGRKVGCASGAPPAPSLAPQMPFIVQEATFSLSTSEHEMQMPGNPEIIARETEDYNRVVAEWKEEVRRAELEVFRTRVGFLLCGVVVLCGIGSFLYFGIDSLRSSLDYTFTASDRVSQLVTRGINATDTFLAANDESSEKTVDLLATNENWCPASTSAVILNYKQNIKDIGAAVSAKNDNAAYVTDVKRANADLNEVQGKISALNDDLNKANIAFYVGMAIAFFQAIVTVVLMGGVISAWVKGMSAPFRCVQSYLILPVFLLLTLVSVVLSVVFVSSSIAFSDLCVGGPDGRVQSFMQMFKDRIDPMAFSFLNYYVSGCTQEPVLDHFSYVPLLINATETTSNFVDSMDQETVDLLTLLCGAETPLIVAVANLLKTSLNSVERAVQTTVDVVQCSNGNGIYTDVAYNAICYDGISGMYGIYFSQLVIVVFSLIMVTTRVSWQDVEVDTLIDDKESVMAERSMRAASTSSMSMSKAGKNRTVAPAAGKGSGKKYGGLEGDNIEMLTIMGEASTKAGSVSASS
mmetsp:Transcript_20264/g.25057  ORF Transcript_20264/g.25057 Transcript_20264/m.25057 type:complete len:606 (+) Transcript_20264:286-2103(+)|eukprot:CAMPEP_0172513188 /NCGR_PEP_ID=MMETSP1066-20121228/250419_1 /TAXON_ID=671091 /ORGANISM="Coscinodiscus wailesii, Strain CCMP2513" /LENGTH=605 /DNA_ID=CAMNT_0013293339 /DNA_START=263 /DNA_END=2080 /DNA_ORIENTATION=-